MAASDISTETLLDTPAVRKPYASSAELGLLGRKRRKGRKQKKFWLLQQLRAGLMGQDRARTSWHPMASQCKRELKPKYNVQMAVDFIVFIVTVRFVVSMFHFILRRLNSHATCAEGSVETLKHAQIAQITHSLAELQRSGLLTSTQAT